MLSSSQAPLVQLGTEFPVGTVVAIKNDHVLLDTEEGVKRFSFSQIEEFVHVERSLSQA